MLLTIKKEKRKPPAIFLESVEMQYLYSLPTSDQILRPKILLAPPFAKALRVSLQEDDSL